MEIRRERCFPQIPISLISWELSLIVRFRFGPLLTALVAALIAVVHQSPFGRLRAGFCPNKTWNLHAARRGPVRFTGTYLQFRAARSLKTHGLAIAHWPHRIHAATDQVYR
jgi:hypothetical protein